MRDFADWAMGRFVLAGAFVPILGEQLVRTPYLRQILWTTSGSPSGRTTSYDPDSAAIRTTRIGFVPLSAVTRK